MRLSRKPWFFLGMAVTCLLLLSPTPPQFRWVNLSMAVLSTFWFILLALEEILAGRRNDRPHVEGGRR